MRDPYEVLGVPRSANAAAIKSAFRKLAKKHHPDSNKNDPKAAAKFAEINTANEILGDEDKRKQFDRGEIDAEGKPRFQGFPAAAIRAAAPAPAGSNIRSAPAAVAPAAAVAAAVLKTSSTACSAGAALRAGNAAAGAQEFDMGGIGLDLDVNAALVGVAGGCGQGRREARAAAQRQGAQRQEFRPVSSPVSRSGCEGRARPRRAIAPAMC